MYKLVMLIVNAETFKTW